MQVKQGIGHAAVRPETVLVPALKGKSPGFFGHPIERLPAEIGALADEVEFALSQKGIEPISTEGFDSKNWVLLDYSNVIVHVFVPNTRTYYDLEHLWADGEPIDISEYLTPDHSL